MKMSLGIMCDHGFTCRNSFACVSEHKLYLTLYWFTNLFLSSKNTFSYKLEPPLRKEVPSCYQQPPVSLRHVVSLLSNPRRCVSSPSLPVNTQFLDKGDAFLSATRNPEDKIYFFYLEKILPFHHQQSALFPIVIFAVGFQGTFCS